jgi:23S rRNA pseudouridine1911/1915/1917 synthase
LLRIGGVKATAFSMSDTQYDIRDLVADEDAAGQRTDRWLASHWTDMSRSRLKALIDAGHLSRNGEVMSDPSAKVLDAARYVLDVPAPRAAEPEPEKMDLDILHEDEDLIVILKPAGLTVHPAAGNWSGTLVHGLLYHCAGSLSGIGGVERPGIVHRLDKDTSGVMVVAKSDAAHKGLTEQFAAHTVERAYIAFTRKSPSPRDGRIETQLVRSEKDRKKFAVPRDPESQAGKHAITNYTTLARYGQVPDASIGTALAAKVECRLETGRTHQIRIHMAHLGCSLLGDPLYGKPYGGALAAADENDVFKNFRRQALHAAMLGFVHPVTGKTLRFESEITDDMKQLEAFLKTV